MPLEQAGANLHLRINSVLEGFEKKGEAFRGEKVFREDRRSGNQLKSQILVDPNKKHRVHSACEDGRKIKEGSREFSATVGESTIAIFLSRLFRIASESKVGIAIFTPNS